MVKRTEDTLPLCAICVAAIVTAQQRGWIKSIDEAIGLVRQNGHLNLGDGTGYFAHLAVTTVNGTAYCAWHCTKVIPTGYAGGI